MKRVLIVLLCLVGHDLIAMSRTKPMMFNPRLLKGTHEIEGVPQVRTSPVVVQTLPQVSSVAAQSKTISPQVAMSKALQKGWKPIARR